MVRAYLARYRPKRLGRVVMLGTPNSGSEIADRLADEVTVRVLEQQLLAFGRRYEQIATPFEWKLTRQDLNRLLDRLGHDQALQPALRAA